MQKIFPYAKPCITSIEAIKEYKEMREMLSRFSKAGEKYSQGACYASGLSEGQKNALCAVVMSDKELFSGRFGNGTGIVLCQDEKNAYAMNAYLSAFGLETAVFPARDYNFHNISATSHEWEYERLKVLRRVLSCELDAVIAVPDAAFGILPEPEKIKDGLVLEMGKSISIEKVLMTLEMYGYSNCDTVEGPGQYSRRGDILDIFVPDFENPVRFEFFGDDIDASGFFDVMTQRRTENVMTVSVTPIRECMPDEAALERIYERMDSLIAAAKRKKNADAAEKIMKEKADLENGFLPNIDKYIPLLYDRKCTLFDYAGGSVFACDYPRVRDRLRSILWQTEQDITDVASAGEADLKDAVFCLDADSAKAKMMSRPCVITDTFNSTPDIEISGLFEFSSKHTSMSVENIDILCEDIEDYKKADAKYRLR
jgi:transcription-repair coupling factor (superfamily II helicase)